MPLNVTLSRDTQKVDLGTFSELMLTEDELRAPDRQVARHLQHRWHAEPHGRSFPRMDVTGPLKLKVGQGADATTMGPYLHFHLINGVAYVDQRIFGFFDLEKHDWYIVDEGTHTRQIAIVAHSAEG